MKRPLLPEDPGLAIERTVMAWGRTALGLVGMAALLVRFGERERIEAVAYPVAAITLLAGGLTWWASRDGYHGGRLPLISRRALRAFAAAMVVIALGTIATVLLGLR